MSESLFWLSSSVGYNGYMFSPTSSGSERPAAYNPQLVFVHLENIISGGDPASHLDEANAVHTTTVLSVVDKTDLSRLAISLICSTQKQMHVS